MNYKCHKCDWKGDFIEAVVHNQETRHVVGMDQ